MVRRTITTALLALTLLAMTACTRDPQISTQAAGHKITAWIQGDGVKSESKADGVLLSSDLGQVTIERTRMRIEGEPWVQIPDGAPITVNIKRGQIALKAGNVNVSRSVSN
jgi:hypothetical protein